MKLAVVVLLVASACADVSHILPKSGEAGAEIVSQELNVGLQGQYQYAYQTANGISGREQGELRQVPGAEVPAEVVNGQSSYTAPDGTVIELTYTADENGFNPQGAHLPTPPPIPELIQRSLEYIRANPPKEIK